MPNITRDELLALPDAGRREEFVEFASYGLSQFPDDVEMRLALVRCLTEFGLLHRASIVANGFDPEVVGKLALDSLVEHLSVPRQNGLCDWEMTQGVFDRNIAALRRRYAWTDAVVDTWQTHSGDLELHRTRDGRYEVFDRGAERWRPVFRTHGPTETVEAIRRNVENRVVAPVFIEGVGLGQFLPRYVEATHETLNSSAPFVFQIETDWLGIATALHLVDWTSIVAEPRVIICVGPDAYDQLDRSINEHPNAPKPKALIIAPPWQAHTGPRAETVMRRHVQSERDEAAALRRDVESIYAGRNAAYWARRYEDALRGDGPPLRVMSVACRFTTVLKYATRDALAALEAEGCETHCLIEPDDQSHISSVVAFRTIKKFQPDLILLIDHTRQSQPAIVFDEIPLLTWVQDRLPWLFDRQVGQAMTPLDFVMGQAKRELVERYHYPADRFLGCDMATDVAQLTNQLPPESDPARLECELAFATHASETPAAFAESRYLECDRPDVLALLKAIEARLSDWQSAGTLNGALNFEAMVDALAQETSAALSVGTRDAVIYQFARPLAERMIRQETIRWAASWATATGARFHLYGNGWDSHPEFAAFAKGPLSHGAELGEAFRRAKINLHAGCNIAFHQRVLDGLAAGGFFLLRRHGSDIGFPVVRAIREAARSAGRSLPTSMRGADLQPPWSREFARLRRMKGVDPDGAVEVTAEKLARLDATCDMRHVILPDQLWPSLEDLTFGSEAEFVEQVERFLSQPDARSRVAGPMREQVIEHFSYRPLMKKVISWLKDGLAREADAVDSTTTDMESMGRLVGLTAS